MKRVGIGLLVATVSLQLALLISCSAKPEQAGGENLPEGAPKWRIGMSQCNLGEPWRVQMNADIKKKSLEFPGIDLGT